MTRIIQITDLHIDNNDEELKHMDARAKAVAILEAIRQEEYEELVITGDISESESGITWFLEELGKYKIKYRFVMGNHDNVRRYISIDNLNEATYYVRKYDDFLGIFLDSSQGTISTVQLDWLQNQVKNEENNILAFIHHPVLDCDNSTMDKKYSLRNRNEIAQIFEKAKSKVAIFCGHYHTDDKREKNNIVQYVTPSTLYQLKKDTNALEVENTKSGYRIISVENKRIETTTKYLK